MSSYEFLRDIFDGDFPLTNPAGHGSERVEYIPPPSIAEADVDYEACTMSRLSL
jgi:hypothetical protein